jgi:DNA-binding MarR family transcriptional regulator
VSRRLASTTNDVVLEAEGDIRAKLRGERFDFTAMSAVTNIYRAGTAVRNHMERTVLAEYDLSWVAFTVLWVLWIWDEQETAHVAEEAGISKGTLTGVIKTLTARSLVIRSPHPDDARRATVRLNAKGRRTITKLFPQFNEHESAVVAPLSATEQVELARLLRKVIRNATSLTDED